MLSSYRPERVDRSIHLETAVRGREDRLSAELSLRAGDGSVALVLYTDDSAEIRDVARVLDELALELDARARAAERETPATTV